MRTQMMILAVVGVALLISIAIIAALVWLLGRVAGLGLSLGLAVVLGGVYLSVVKPWKLRWGATDDEVARSMPRGDLIPGAGSATRGITIAAPAEVI